MNEIEALSQFIKPKGRCTKCMAKIIPDGDDLYFDWDVGKPKSAICVSCFNAGVRSRNGFF